MTGSTAPRRAPSGPKAEVARALSCVRSLVATLARSARAVEDSTGITNAQLFILRELISHPGISINDLAARAMTTQSTASILVTRLERAGLVRRTRAADDARRVVLALTPKGRRTADRAPEPPTRKLIAALQHLPAAKRRALAQSVEALLDELHAPRAGNQPLFEPLRSANHPRRRQPR